MEDHEKNAQSQLQHALACASMQLRKEAHALQTIIHLSFLPRHSPPCRLQHTLALAHIEPSFDPFQHIFGHLPFGKPYTRTVLRIDRLRRQAQDGNTHRRQRPRISKMTISTITPTRAHMRHQKIAHSGRTTRRTPRFSQGPTSQGEIGQANRTCIEAPILSVQQPSLRYFENRPQLERRCRASLDSKGPRLARVAQTISTPDILWA